MHRNPFWYLLLFILFTISGWFFFITSCSLYDYYSFTKQVELDTVVWGVESWKEEQFFLNATYSYRVEGERFSGKEVFTDQFFWNRWGAEKEVAEREGGVSRVWIDPHNPERATLQLSFPIKGVVYTLILFLLSLYFIILGYYVGKKKG